jgi:hypothetical protein
MKPDLSEATLRDAHLRGVNSVTQILLAPTILIDSGPLPGVDSRSFLVKFNWAQLGVVQPTNFEQGALSLKGNY